jgi:hypothetical protein
MSMPSQASMPMPAPMPLMSAMPAMMCHMTCEMNEDGMVCMMTPADDTTMDMLKDCCSLMQSMMDCGMPCMMTCNGMPMMMMCGMPMLPMMSFEMAPQGMICTMKPNEGMNMAMLDLCCDMMERMMMCGMPMTMMCGGMPLMMCVH